MLDLLKRTMNQRMAFGLLVLCVASALLAARRLESSGYVTMMLGLIVAYYGEQALGRRPGGSTE
jgi:uncharacterized membrane protein